MDEEELPRLTLGLLRRADTMCPRRLHFEHTSKRKPSRLGDMAFAVSNRITEEAILWHKGSIGTDSPVMAFPEPTDLEPEQRALYAALAQGYQSLFPQRDVVVTDLGWSTEIDEFGVQLVGQVGIAVTHADGVRELRMLRTGLDGRLVDDIEMRFAVLRCAEWGAEQFTITAANLLTGTSMPYDIDLADHLEDARNWLFDRLGVITSRASRDRELVGADCRTCSFIPGCGEVTKS